MIYTVTFNPSLDYVVQVNDFKLGIVNRTVKEEILFGGKGINVSWVLKNLGQDSIALGFVAGFTGQEIEAGIQKHGCKTDFIHLESGVSRINVKLKSHEESEINGQGPHITKADLEQLYSQLDRLEAEDILVLAGSIPSTLSEDVYEKIVDRLQHKNIHIVVDATKDLLLRVLKYKPFLIKPNAQELGELFGIPLTTDEEIISCAKKLRDMGARNVLVSMASRGAILVSQEGKIYRSEAPKGEVVNSVGAGDSMVAGFITGYLETGSMLEAFRMGIAAGSASAFSPYLATKEAAIDLLNAGWQLTTEAYE